MLGMHHTKVHHFPFLKFIKKSSQTPISYRFLLRHVSFQRSPDFLYVGIWCGVQLIQKAMVLCIEEGKTPMIWTDGLFLFLST